MLFRGHINRRTEDNTLHMVTVNKHGNSQAKSRPNLLIRSFKKDVRIVFSS